MHTLAFVENIFFLVLIAIVGLIRWIAQAAEAKKNAESEKRINPPPANAPPARAPAQTEEERIRRFMEALGVPTSNAPPPKAPQPRQVVPKQPRETRSKKIMPVDPFPRPKPAWFPRPEVETPPVIVAPTEPIAEVPAPVAAPTPLAPPPARSTALDYEISAVEADRKAASWAARLATAGSARDALVLREIFGPPRSLQSVEQELLTRI